MRRNGLHADLVEKLRVDDELHRSIRVEDRAGTAATVPLQLQEYKAAEQTLEELVRRWPVRETPWLLRLRSAAARKSGAEVRSILQEMERTQVYLSAAGRQELAFWKGGAA